MGIVSLPTLRVPEAYICVVRQSVVRGCATTGVSCLELTRAEMERALSFCLEEQHVAGSNEGYNLSCAEGHGVKIVQRGGESSILFSGECQCVEGMHTASDALKRRAAVRRQHAVGKVRTITLSRIGRRKQRR
jgi:hypothetical protein